MPLPCRISFPKAATVAGMVSVAPMFVLVGSVMVVASIERNGLALVVVPELTEGNEPAAATEGNGIRNKQRAATKQQAERPCLVVL